MSELLLNNVGRALLPARSKAGDYRASLVVSVAAASVSIFAGFGIAAWGTRPVSEAGLCIGALALALWTVRRLGSAGVLVLLLVFLPLQGIVLTHAPHSAVVPIRYGPELLALASAVWCVATRPGFFAVRLRGLIAPLLSVILVWGLSATVAGDGVRTVAIGFRAELSFMSLLLIAMTLPNPTRAAFGAARTLLVTACIESALAVAQYAVPGLRSPFAQDWVIRLGGQSSASGPQRLDTVFGTFSNYNALGTYLVLAVIVAIAAGSEGLKLPRAATRGAIGVVLIGIVVSGSRESLVAALIALMVIGRAKYRFPTYLVAAGVAVAALMLGAFNNASSPAQGRSLSGRIQTLVTPSAWAANYHTNFRSYYTVTEAHAVARTDPLLGYGLGTVTDQRKIADGTSPLYDTYAGQQAVAFSYQYDSNWTVMLIETGFGGVAAFVWLLASFGRVAAGVRDHWLRWAVPAAIAVAVALAFFAPVFQLPTFAAPLWLFAGLAIALRHQATAAASQSDS